MLVPLLYVWLLLLNPAAGSGAGSGREWRVIGAGLGRTGTDSMKHALKTLGFGDIYHMKDLLRGHNCTRDHMQTVWAPLARGDFNISDIRERLQCFGGGVDYPVSPFFRELMDIYPTAKVLLTTRSPKSWTISAFNSICPAALTRGADFNMTRKFQIPWHIRVIRLFLPQAPGTEMHLYKDLMSSVVSKIERPYAVYADRMGKRTPYESKSVESVLGKDLFLENIDMHTPAVGSGQATMAYCRGSTDEMMTLFEAWEFYVRSVVPPERLVVFEIGKDGWEELCAALNVSLPLINPELPRHPTKNPTVPFPHINTTSDYFNMMLGQRLLATLIIVSLSLSFILVVVVVWYYCCRSRRKFREGLSDRHYSEMYEKLCKEKDE